MTSQHDKAERFRALHVPGAPLLLANPWDAGSARVLASLGFHALATTSGGMAATLGRRDGSATRDEALASAATIVRAVDVPVSADLENAFAHEPAGVAETIGLAMEAGLAGCSVEDYTQDVEAPLYGLSLAADRVAAAAEAAHGGGVPFVLTARAENHLRGHDDLSDTIRRLQAFQQAGADVLYAPGLVDRSQIAEIVSSVDLPVNVLALPGAPPVAELAEVGVARVSVGSAFSLVAMAAVAEAATELLEHGSYGYLAAALRGNQVISAAF